MSYYEGFKSVLAICVGRLGSLGAAGYPLDGPLGSLGVLGNMLVVPRKSHGVRCIVLARHLGAPWAI